jgi:cytochrome c
MRVLTLSGFTLVALLTTACGGGDKPAETPVAETPAVAAPVAPAT